MANIPPNTAPTAGLKQRLDRLQSDLAAQRRSLNRSATLTLVIGLLLLGVLAAYFYYGYTQIASATQPERLIDVAEMMIDDNLPKARASLEKEVDKNAAKWAEGLSKKARASLPELRVKAETYFVEQADKSLDESAVVTEQHFRSFVKENRPMLEKAFKDLEKNPELADASLAEMEQALDKELQTDLRTSAAATIDALNLLTEKLKKLRAGKNLSAEEQTERELVMIVRRLQLDSADGALPSTGSNADPKTLTPVGEKPASKTPAPPVKPKTPAPKPPDAKKQ